MNVAIVGFGPRGLACLENLILSAADCDNFQLDTILLFDAGQKMGTGLAWRLDQPETNCINISHRALVDLKGREQIVWNGVTIPSFPSYVTWCVQNEMLYDINSDKDQYPARSQMGQYLHQRAKSMYLRLEEVGKVKLIKEEVTQLEYDDRIISLSTNNVTYRVDECLLTLGHLPTEDTEEDTANKKHASINSKPIYIHDPYKKQLAREDLGNRNVIIKGFGLTMLDVMKQLTSYRFGSFHKKHGSHFLEFEPSKGCVRKIIPYSHDGLPLVPKPYGREVDAKFIPDEQQKNAFELTIRNALAEAEKQKDIQFVLNAFAEVAVPIHLRITGTKDDAQTLEAVVLAWLKDTDIRHESLLDTGLPVVEYLKKTIAMSLGKSLPTLDYTMGQIWRHLQPLLYRLFAFSGVSGKVMNQLITVDEFTKRYSYGPPVESMLEVLALEAAGILDVGFVNNPDVSMMSQGWRLRKDKLTITAGMLCNSVLDTPNLNLLQHALIQSLKKHNLIHAVNEGLGIATYPDATVRVPDHPDKRVPIAVVGRNAKGSVLGTDAILECFSPETKAWAEGVVSRQIK
ncbi:MAG TPA: FAD/NAD(P)-binding protein [Flavobacteriaceae bacterium]|nr:FAD/NAD(P)-binding protein [Flavobacteriaceae bacterium]